MSYYWINTLNMAEVGGPHETKDAARRDCIAKYDKMNTAARAVVIAEVVEEGSVERTVSWVAAGGRLDVDALNSLGGVQLAERSVPRYDESGGLVDREYVIAGPGGSMYPKDHLRWLHWPWYATKDQFLSAYVGRTEEAKRFYRQMGTDGYVLEPVVAERDIPRELTDCYDRVDAYWLIRIERVPPDLRDQFPRLRGDVHAVDYDRLPQWQRSLYGFDEAAGKTVLRAAAWGNEQ